ncbi:hypothetical protein [Peptoniphilus indolicus]|uniref:CutA divalent ion tolerance protein n=2 Tax=Peptoniphilus indolicus TaxID=33030 RepID=G4D1L3_9FIRM|nr:hypothetical protein [Peptoniphilus indolicus]EGY80593.1 CutA divalent ion tolerance protein [Peptoniphilus indolicus ATCC 29427]SUB74986.1 Uncharacterized protein conserved in bacteria [Peptoniphilus indolicus]SUB94787.1 Uncharacterized protein conserved in bacteria [Peptoniphilus indolicus]SUB94794.1 Uncharacterized protein conserved in bacteria [Peptoniphilus indolicus]
MAYLLRGDYVREYIKVEVYIPEENVIKLVNALNEEGILRDGNYDYVFATSNVTGHFRPIEGANPYTGEIGVVSEIREVRLEFRIRSAELDFVKDVIKECHPYEEPVVNYLELL